MLKGAPQLLPFSAKKPIVKIELFISVPLLILMHKMIVKTRSEQYKTFMPLPRLFRKEAKLFFRCGAVVVVVMLEMNSIFIQNKIH